MSKDRLGYGYPQAIVDPIAPLLRAEAVLGDIAAGDEMVLCRGERDQPEILLHLTMSDSETATPEPPERQTEVVAA